MNVELSEKELDIISESLCLLKCSYCLSGDRPYINEICDLQTKITDVELSTYPDAREGV